MTSPAKGETRSSLTRAVSLHRRGEIRGRTYALSRGAQLQAWPDLALKQGKGPADGLGRHPRHLDHHVETVELQQLGILVQRRRDIVGRADMVAHLTPHFRDSARA